jgi:predicted nucleic acid-binding protein
MAVVDSSALSPLAWVGRLELIPAVFEDPHTTVDVRDEVLIEGKRGTAALEEFLEEMTIHPTPEDADSVAELEGITPADASVVLLAAEEDDVLLANDKGLIEVARSHGVDSWWITTLLFKCVRENVLSADEATDVLYDLVDEGMNLHPKVYARVQRKLRELDE